MLSKISNAIKNQFESAKQLGSANEKLLSIDIGFRNIKLAEVEVYNERELFLKNFGITPTPKDCIKNGEISDVEEIKSRIFKVLTENDIKTRNTKIVMSGTSIITRIFMVELNPGKSKEVCIQEHISEFMPVDSEKYQMDYKVLQEKTEEGRTTVKVFVSAVRKSIIDSYVQVLKGLNLIPVSIDIPSNSIAKFFNREINVDREKNRPSPGVSRKPRDKEVVAVIDFGSETTIINILKNKILEFNKVILLGSSNIDDAVADKLKIDLIRAENNKKVFGVVEPDIHSTDEQTSVYGEVKTVVDKIIKQIEVCFQFYETKCFGEKVDKIFIIGGGSLLKGLGNYLEAYLDIPVYSISLLSIDGLKIADQLDSEKLSFLINSVGITLKV